MLLHRGSCKGIADTFFGSQHSVKEITCRAMGDDFCEILVSTLKETANPIVE